MRTKSNFRYLRAITIGTKETKFFDFQIQISFTRRNFDRSKDLMKEIKPEVNQIEMRNLSGLKDIFPLSEYQFSDARNQFDIF